MTPEIALQIALGRYGKTTGKMACFKPLSP